jgi:hypothetical protein
MPSTTFLQNAGTCPAVCLRVSCTSALSFIYSFICGLLNGIFSSYTTNTQQISAR